MRPVDPDVVRSTSGAYSSARLDSLRLQSRPGTLPGSPSDEVRRASFRAALSHASLRWLLAHHAFAGIGQSFGTVAVATAVFASTGSGAWVAVAAAARLVPYLIFSGPAGVLGDRIDRRFLLFASAVLRGIVAAVLLVAYLADASAGVLVGLVFVGTALGTGSYPTLIALIPQSVPLRDVAPANALVNTLETAVWLVGPALGGLVVAATGATGPALAVNVALFGVGALLLGPVRRSAPAPQGPRPPSTFRRDLADGLRSIGRTPAVRSSLVMVIAVNVVMGAAPVLTLLAADELLGDSMSGYATLTAALGAGGFIGVAFTNRLAAGTHLGRRLAAVTLATGIPFAVLVVVGAVPVAAALLAVAGGAAVVTEVVALTVMLRSLPDAVAARVFGFVDAMLVGALLAGSVIAPTLVGAVSLEGALVAVGVAVPLLAVAVALPWGRERAAAT